jgi:hypothetical protein
VEGLLEVCLHFQNYSHSWRWFRDAALSSEIVLYSCLCANENLARPLVYLENFYGLRLVKQAG